MQGRHFIIAAACWTLTGVGSFSFLVAALIFLGVLRAGTKVGLVYGLIGLPFVIGSLILSRWRDSRTAADENRQGFGVLPPGDNDG